MPHSIDLGDLVQDGVLGLIDAAHRFDEGRGIKFETFAERRVRGAMIDALRRDAWPRGVRRVRRELEAAREAAAPRARRRADARRPRQARRAPTKRASSARSSASTRSNRRRRWRTSKRSTARRCRPCSCRASRRRPIGSSNRPRCAIACARRSRSCRRASAASSRLYYFGEATMKQIGEAIGVNESRVSQLHARAIAAAAQSHDGRPAASSAPKLVAEADASDAHRGPPRRRDRAQIAYAAAAWRRADGRKSRSSQRRSLEAAEDHA